MRRNLVYSCGIITFTHLARSRRRSPDEILHQIGKLHPIGHAQKQTLFTHQGFWIGAPEIGPSHGNRPNPAAIRLQQKPLAIAIVSLSGRSARRARNRAQTANRERRRLQVRHRDSPRRQRPDRRLARRTGRPHGHAARRHRRAEGFWRIAARHRGLRRSAGQASSVSAGRRQIGPQREVAWCGQQRVSCASQTSSESSRSRSPFVVKPCRGRIARGAEPSGWRVRSGCAYLIRIPRR